MTTSSADVILCPTDLKDQFKRTIAYPTVNPAMIMVSLDYSQERLNVVNLFFNHRYAPG